MPPQIGKPAPAFTLSSTSGAPVALKNLKGQKVVLYFYPKDNTSGCTKEACAFKGAHPDYSRAQRRQPTGFSTGYEGSQGSKGVKGVTAGDRRRDAQRLRHEPNANHAQDHKRRE